jgi:hypothetical protein
LLAESAAPVVTLPDDRLVSGNPAEGKRLIGTTIKCRAVIAVAHTLLLLVYQVLQTNKPFEDRRGPPMDERQKQRLIRHHPVGSASWVSPFKQSRPPRQTAAYWAKPTTENAPT